MAESWHCERQNMNQRPAFEWMTQADLAALRRAVQLLEHPSLAARLTNMVGRPIELIGYALPASASQVITTATSKALEMALHVAVRTMDQTVHPGSQRFHKVLATASGAAGGALGLAMLPIELPVSTIIMLRSIAEIARSEGEDLSDPETALSCMQVFALGGRPDSADASESGYFAVRGLLAKSVTQAARFIVERGVIEEGAPILVRFSSRRKPFRWSAPWAALRSTTHSSSTSKTWRGAISRCADSSGRTAKNRCVESTNASRRNTEGHRAHMPTVTLRFSPSLGSSPVAQALANSKTVTAVLAGPSHNSALTGSMRNRRTLGSEGPPGHHASSGGRQISFVLEISRVTEARPVIDR
jgi:EcsC protein family